MKYLARLKSEICPPLVLSKLPEPPFSIYSSTVGKHILKNNSGLAVIDIVKVTPELEAPTPKKATANISPVALAWLREHRQQLKAAGWTARELWRRNKSKGICWCGLWDKPFLKVYLHDDGVIEFECVDGGRDVSQTARPESMRALQ